MDIEEESKSSETLDESVVDYSEEDEQTKKSTEPKLAKVEYDYQAKETDELSLDKGDVVTVIEQVDKGWWKGDLNGKIGMFPANHVKLIEVPSKPDGEENEENAENQSHLPRKLKTYGVRPGGIGSLFSGGIPLKNKRNQSSKNDDTSTLKKTTSRSASEDSESTKDDKLASPPMIAKSPTIPKLPPKKRRTKQNTATVMYDYDAEEEGEISLKEGTTITILEKTDDGWWRGKNEQGEAGIFPSTYVTEIKTTDASPTAEEADSEKPAKTEEQELQQIPTSPKRTKSPEQPTSPRTVQIGEDSKSPVTPPRRPTNPPSNRTSTHEDSLNRQSIHESTDESRQSTSESGESNVTRRPPSLISPDLPPMQYQSPRHPSKSTLPGIPTDIDKSSDTYSEIVTSPISPVERPVPPRPRPTSQHEAKSDSPKSPPPLARPPTIPKPSFAPAKPPTVQRRSTRKDSKNAPGETNSETSEEQIEKIESSENQETYDDDKPSFAPAKPPTVQRRSTRKDSKNAPEPDIDSNKETDVQQTDIEHDDTNSQNDQEDTVNQDNEIKEKQPEPPVIATPPRLPSLGVKERPTRSRPPTKNIKNPSQSDLLEKEVASAKDEEPPKSQVTPPKPEKPAKPSMFKLPIAGAGVPPVALRPVAKRVVEPPTSSSEPSEPSSTSSSNTDSKPIGSVKSISNRFNIPNVSSSSEVEFRLKKWFNEEINKVKANFEARLAEERSKREALEETVRELQERLEE
ncbi:27658_t:CDS:10 [Dentiscutata erythropus]|uniref:27658_t:CDS:1 n=1 Tax=Dentiscutata erythropus TaxID=1348616 RepID=A0A9N9F9R2_9GLOM|nr:27658_t:CDS:10 [Dentiscutata erythropus]